MIDETVILLSPLKDYSKHRLAKYIGGNLLLTVSFDLYFYKPLQEIFSKAIVYDYIQQMTEIGVTATGNEIINLVRKEHPKYVLWISVNYELQESTFESIRREGTVVVGCFHDDETCFDHYSKWWIPVNGVCPRH